MKIAIATSEKVPFLARTERPLLQLFKDKGIEAVPEIWNNDEVNWKNYDLVLIRSIWDYHLNIDRFNEWLSYLELSEIRTLNSSNILKENQHKFYLQKLDASGISIIPTLFIKKTNSFSLDILDNLGWDKAVIKPAISASSYLTEAFVVKNRKAIESNYREIAREKDLLVQKFMQEIQDFGEISMFFFNRKYVYSIIKKAKKGEFRVQSEYGGYTTLFSPEQSTIETASHILSKVEGDILYARVDGTIKNKEFILMELELIEPELFLHFHKKGYEWFVNACLELFCKIPRK